jgi:hypothetical protein
MPMTSIGSPGVYSPTSATTLDVPMSSPTISDLSPLRFMRLPAVERIATARVAPAREWIAARVPQVR